MAKFKLQEACNRAKEALEHGDSERAIAMCQHIVRYYPRCVEAYRLLGEAYLERGGTVTADKLFSYVVQADPQNVLAHIGRAIIREERGDIDAAINEFERAFEIDPAISELREELLRLYTSRFGSEGAKIRTSRVGLAHLYARDYLFPQAINEYHDILRSEPRLDVRVALAVTLWRAGNDAAAADLCNAILQQVPNNLQANLILGQIWLTQGQRDDALALFRRAMDLDPDNTLARSLFESRAGRITLPPLTYYAAELPKWDGNELSASSELPTGLSEVVELEEDALPPHLVEAAAATGAPESVAPPIEFTAAQVGEQFAAIEREAGTEAGLDQTPDWLLSAAPAAETAYSAAGQENAPVAPPELQRQRLDRSEFLQRLASAGLGSAPASDQPTSVTVDLPAGEIPDPAAESALEPLDENSTDWLEQLAARTRFDAAAPMSSAVDQPQPRERGFLDELLGEEEAPAAAQQPGWMNPAPVESEAPAQTAPVANSDGEIIPAATTGDAATAIVSVVSEEATAQPEVSASAATPSRRTTGPLPDLDEEQVAAPAEAIAAMPIRTQPYNPDSPLDILGLFQLDGPDHHDVHAAPTDQPPTVPTEPLAVGYSSAPAAATAPPPTISTAAPSATTSEEDTMPAPSYAEDDEQGRTFEFDWDKEGLPDYLKEFALGENSSLGSPPEPTPASPAQADEGLPSWLTSTSPAADTAPTLAPAASAEGLPSWLSAAPAPPEVAAASTTLPPPPPANAALLASVSPATPTAAPISPASGLDDLAGMPDWLTSASPANQPLPQPERQSSPPGPSSDIDMDGLPSWLSTATPSAPSAAATPSAPPPSTLAHAPNLSGLDSMDMDGLPSWLSNAAPAPEMPAALSPTPPPAPAMARGNDMAGLDSMDMDGLPSWLNTAVPASVAPPTPTASTMPAAPMGNDRADLDSMDMEGLPSWLTPTQLASATASQPAASADSLDDLGLPSWLAAEPAAQATPLPSMPSSLQPFTFADSGTPITTAAGNAGGRAYAAPLDDQPAPPAAAGFGNLQPFSFDDIQFTPPGGQAPNAAMSSIPSSSFDVAAPADDLADLEDFVDFLKPTTPAAAQSPMAGIPTDLKPFSFDDLDLGAPAQPFAPPPSSFDAAPRVQPFSLADTTPPAMPSATSTPPLAAQDYALPASLKPFSLDDFDFGAPSTASSQPGGSSSPAVSDFGTIASPPPAASAFPPQEAFGIPTDLKPFSFDDFDNLAAPLPEQSAYTPASIPPTPPTTDLADYRLPADLRPFALESGSGAAGQSASTEFDFAPFNFDDLMQDSPPPQSASGAATLSMADLGLADTTPSRSGERPSLLESDFEEPSNVDVRGFSWQQSANREPTAPLVTASAEDEGGSMFAKLRRRKEELERNEPSADEPVSDVPPVGAPLSAEERNELAMMNWPMELQDMDAAPTAQVSEPLAQVTPEAAMPAEPISPPVTDYAIGAAPAQPANQLETQAAGGDEFDLSGLDLSPEERAYLLGEDLPISGLEAVRHMQEQVGSGDYLVEQPSAPRDYLIEQPGAPSEEQLEAAVERDFVQPLAEPQAASSEPLAASIERDFVMPIAEQQATPTPEYQPAASSDAGVTSFADQIRDALDRVGSGPVYTSPAADMEMAATPAAEAEAPSSEEPTTTSSRERWVDFLASPPRPPIEIPTPEPSAAQAEAEPEFTDMYATPAEEQGDISFEPPAATTAIEQAPTVESEAVEADYMVSDEQPVAAVETSSNVRPSIEPAPTYVPPALPTVQPSSYVSPAAPVVPPSAYVPPARPLYMDSRPAPATLPPTQPSAEMGGEVSASAAPQSAEEALIEQITPIEPTRPTPALRPSKPSYAPTLPADDLNSVSALRSFVDTNRNDVTARLVLARAYENNEDYDNALEQYRLIVKSKSVPAAVLEDVVSSLQDMLTIEDVGNNPRAHRVLGDAYMKQGLFQHAISQYNWLLSK